MGGKINFLEWDSNFFGYKIGELFSNSMLLNTNIRNALNDKYKLLYCKVDSNDHALNEECLRNSGILVDERITFLRNIPKADFQNGTTELFEGVETNDKLINLALQSGIFSRFKVDVNFKNNEFEKLYTTWISKSVSKQNCEKIVIQKQNEDIVGVLTLGIKSERIDIGLLAVEELYRGKNIGANLMNRAFFEGEKMNIDLIQVVTQKANVGACLYYEKMGFKIESIVNVYHFWLNNKK